MVRVILVVALILMAVAPCNVAAAPPVHPVAPELLAGTALRVPADNFSMDTPGSDWLWSQAQLPEDGGSLYLCQRSGGGRFLVGVIPDRSRGAENWFQGVLDDNLASQRRQGRTVSGLKAEPSEVPVAGSYKWTAEIGIPASGNVGWHGYAVRNGRTYLLQYYGSEPELAAAFERWVGSFRLLSTPVGRASDVRSVLAVAIDFGVLVAAVGLTLALNAIAGRQRVNPGTVAACAIVGVVVYQASHLYMRGSLPSSPEAAGEAVGGLVGYAVLPLLCSVGISLLHRKRQQAMHEPDRGRRTRG